LLIVAGLVTGWFVAKDATKFGVIQMMIALLLLTLIIAVIAFWPNHWKMKSRQSEKTNT